MRGRLIKPYLLLFPALLVFLVLAVYGAALMVLTSFQSPQGGSLAWINYQRVLADPAFLDSLVLSLKISLLSTFGSLVLGVFMAKGLCRCFKKGASRGIFIWLPMLVPHFVAGYLVLTLFAQSGWFSALLYQLQLVSAQSQIPVLVNDRAGMGIIMTYIWKEVPFVVLMLLPVYLSLNKGYVDVVHTLGGDEWQVFKTVEWPWLYPVLLETGVILFAFIISAFEVPFLLGVTYPKMLPVLAFQWFFEGNWSSRPLVMAVFTLTTGLILGLAWAAFRVSQRERYRAMLGKES